MSFQVNNNRPPFPSPFGQQSPPPPGSRPCPPPPPGAPGALPRAPGATPQTALQPPNAVPNRPSGPPPPFGLRPPPPGAFPSVAPSPPGPRPGSFQSSPMTTGQVVPPSGGAPNPFSNGPPAFGSGDMQVGSRFPAAGSMPRPPVGPPPAPPMSLAPSMHSFLGSPPSGSLPGPAQLAPPFSAPPQGVPPPPSGSSSFSAPLQGMPPPSGSSPFSAPPQGMPPPSGSSPFSAPPQGMPPPTGSPFGSRTWAMQPQQAMPPQPPQMFGMPPPLPDQSMAAISPALSHSGTAVAGPSKIDPNQIPRPIPSSSVVLHETRQGNQANPPPPATSEYIVRDTGNCSPRYMRCTINQIPCTNDLLGTSGMQLALLVQPLALPHPSEEPIQVVDFGESGPVRCSRCKGYINPFMKFIDQGRRFICNLCGFTDDTPREYHCNLGPDGRRRDADERPELCRGTVEFVATKEYMVRDPMPALFFFLVDVSMNAIQTGATAAACSAINQVITDLPEGPRTMVGIATFDSTIHFYNLKRALQQPLMLIVPDIQEVYTPLQSDVIVQLSECRQHLEFLLESIPTMFQNNRNADSAFGAAIKAAFLAMKSTGGKLMVFQSVLPSVGIGALSARDAEGRTNISSAEKEAHKLLQPADKTLKTMAIEFAEYQVCVDLFITTQTYIDIASISVIPRTTGGQVYYYYPFSAVSDPAKLYNDLRWNITRPQGFEAVMRVRSSQGLQVQEYSGNFCKRIPTDVDLPAIDCDKTIMVTLKHDEKLQDGAECAFQCALLYTTVYGQRRIRVSTLSLPCTTMLSNLFRSADLDTQFACFLKQVANEIPTSPLLQVREQVTTLCISILHSYRKFCATVSSAGQLILPEALKLLPLYTLENCCWLSYLDCCALSIERRSSLPTSPTSALGVRKRKSSKKRPGSQNSSFDYRREEQLHRIPGRMFLNDSSEVASLFTQQGKKGTNQDAMIVWENFGSRIDTIFYSVFDGHGPYGYMVAKRVRDSLPLKLSAHWEVNLKSDDVLRDVSLNTTGSMNSESTSFLSADEESRASVDVEETEKHLDLFQALKDSFLKAYKVMDRELKMYTNIDCFCSGTTAVTLVKQEDYFYDLPYNTGCQIFVLRLRKTRDEIMKCTLSIDIYFD